MTEDIYKPYRKVLRKRALVNSFPFHAKLLTKWFICGCCLATVKSTHRVGGTSCCLHRAVSGWCRTRGWTHRFCTHASVWQTAESPERTTLFSTRIQKGHVHSSVSIYKELQQKLRLGIKPVWIIIIWNHKKGQLNLSFVQTHTVVM